METGPILIGSLGEIDRSYVERFTHSHVKWPTFSSQCKGSVTVVGYMPCQYAIVSGRDHYNGQSTNLVHNRLRFARFIQHFGYSSSMHRNNYVLLNGDSTEYRLIKFPHNIYPQIALY